MASVTIKPGRVQPIWAGHPWVYAQAIRRREGDLTAGCEVDVRDPKGELLGRGLWSPTSAIAVRLFTRLPQALDLSLFRSRLHAALLHRRQLGLPDSRTTAFRWVYGEGDGLPGLIIDVFGSHVSTQFGTIGLWQRKHELERLIVEFLSPERILDRTPARIAQLEGFATDGLFTGEESPAAQMEGLGGPSSQPLRFIELGIRYAIPQELQQKTGYYCDQRPLREWLQTHSQGRRVLDAFSYVGSLGLNAARGGACRVDCVERSAAAFDAGRAISADNGLTQVTLHQADALQYMQRLPSNSHDLTLCDPPKLAPNKRGVEAASKRLRSLAREAIRVTAPGGEVVLSSCSASVGPRELSRALALGALDARKQVTITQRLFQGLDHPVLAGFDEGEYLSTLVGQVSELK